MNEEKPTYDELEQKNANLERDLLKQRVGMKAGLPSDLIDRINGDDEMSMTADAEQLASFLPPKVISASPLKSSEQNMTSGPYGDLLARLNED